MTNSLVLNEALSIPSVIGKFAFSDKNPYHEIADLINQKKIKYIVTIARGTSDCAALYSSYIFAKYLGLPSYSMPPSIITLEKSKFNFSVALGIVISQSGKSNDLIECEKKSQEFGAITMLISNNENSPIINSANFFFNMFAGIEKSGPEYGFAKLFENRFCILTPINKSDDSFNHIKSFWERIGMQIEIMEARHHDRILAMTSHIPQLIAFSVVTTATELESHMKDEIIKYSAAGFRDFTRLAGSDPIMWRDVYSKNKDAVLEMLGRFSEDLSTFQKAIRNNDLQFLENKFSNSREIRQLIEDLGQAGNFDPTERKLIK